MKIDIIPTDQAIDILNNGGNYEPDKVIIKDASNEYSKSWGKLDKQQKINRLMEYVNRLEISLKLENSEKQQLKKLLISSILEKKISGRDSVEYSNSRIINIPSLKRNTASSYFYLEDDELKITKVTKITSVPKLGKMKKIDLSVFK